jgi:hypothetical protein
MAWPKALMSEVQELPVSVTSDAMRGWRLTASWSTYEKRWTALLFWRGFRVCSIKDELLSTWGYNTHKLTVAISTEARCSLPELQLSWVWTPLIVLVCFVLNPVAHCPLPGLYINTRYFRAFLTFCKVVTPGYVERTCIIFICCTFIVYFNDIVGSSVYTVSNVRMISE